MDKNDYDRKFEERMDNAINELTNCLNNFDDQVQVNAFSLSLSKQHRTLQQNFWRCITAIMKQYGKTSNFDARNE